MSINKVPRIFGHSLSLFPLSWTRIFYSRTLSFALGCIRAVLKIFIGGGGGVGVQKWARGDFFWEFFSFPVFLRSV
jgi:hypothetical protein